MKHILTIILLLSTLTVAAQNNYSPCYTNNMAKGNAAFNQGKYSEARAYFINAKQCNGGNPSVAQQKINSCDAKIKAQKEAAEAKRKADQEAKRKAEEAAAKQRAIAEAKARGYEEITVNGVTFKMIYVEGGTFTMGCTPEQGSDCYDDESPSHQVSLSDFCIGEVEVTQALWKAVMGNNPSRFKGDNLPVENVSWNDCQEFIQKLNQLSGKTFRLPTEAEWEYAARGGKNHSRYKYAGSNDINAVAWCTVNIYDRKENSPDYGTHPVKGKQANELGLYDMSGNVWEWCSDWKRSYDNSSRTNPKGPSSGLYRVLRGGSWYDSPGYCRVFYRYSDRPDFGGFSNGFRLASVRQ